MTYRTRQEIFDEVVAHLRKQGCRSMRSYDGTGTLKCAYRGAEGTRCAIGCLIPDDRYDESLEGDNAEDPTVREAAGISSGDTLLAIRLQNIHDGADPESWESSFSKVAADFELTYTPPTAEVQP